MTQMIAPVVPVVAAEHSPAWVRLRTAVAELRDLQSADGALDRERARVEDAGPLVAEIRTAIAELAPTFPADRQYLDAVIDDFGRWQADGFLVPDFGPSLRAFAPNRERLDGRRHLVVFPMNTQNGKPERTFEALLVEVFWPQFLADLEAGEYSNPQFLPLRFLDFTDGYRSNSAVLFPETVSVAPTSTPVKYSWGGIFTDREAARFQRVTGAAAALTGYAVPEAAQPLLTDPNVAMSTFAMWDLIHDRTHMHGDLPFDPFMIKQRMPYFLYALEELRCDLTAFAEAVRLAAQGHAVAELVQYAIVYDRIFRFPISGNRVRNYDGLGGQLLFAWLHQHRVLQWTDNRLHIDWPLVPAVVLELGRAIDELYWRSIDRPKIAHWLAAYELLCGTLTPHPASTWARGVAALPVAGPLRGMTDAVLDDEFPLSMFYESLSRGLSEVVAGTAGIIAA